MQNGTSSASIRYGGAIVAVFLAMVVRLGLDPALGDSFPFATMFLAVLAVAGYAGLGPALLTTVLGAFTSAWFLLPPRGGFQVRGFDNRAGLVLYLVVSGGIALLGGALRAARQRAEQDAAEAARQREELRTTLSSIGDAVLVTNAEGRVTSLNAIAQELTGWSSAEAEGQPLGSIFRIVDEETQEPIENPASRALKEGVIVGIADHTSLIAKDGTLRPIADSAAPIRDERGQVAGVVIIFRDVTERRRQEILLKESEHRSRAILESITDGFFAVDGSWRFTYVNRQAEQILDRKPGDLFGKVLWDEYPGLIGSEFERAYRRAAHERIASAVTLHYPDHDRWYESHAYPAEEGVSIYFRNVTERVHAEERERWLLAEAALANTKFRAFFEQGPLFAGIMALDGTIIESNRLSLEACGYTREDVVGKFFWECPWWRNSGDAAERIRAATARAAAGETFRAEMPYYVADGSERIVDLIVMPIKDESGAVVFLAPTGTDITDRKRAEDALRESEQRFRSLADSVPVHVWMDDEQGRGILANARYVEYSGQSVEDLLKNSWPDILHPDDKDRFLDEFGAAFTARDQFRGEVRLRNREGIYRWFDVIGRPRLEGERFAGYVGISVDVTARKLAEEALSQSEERFRHLAAAMPQIVWIARPDHTVEFYNKRWFQYTGLGVEETYQADGWRLPVHPDDIDRILEASARAEASGEPFEAEFRLRDRYGVYRWHLGRAVAVRDREGRVVRRFGTTTDIDDRKQAEAALLAARDEAEEANRAKTQFLAVLSHELRTPLNPILLAASSMLDRPTEPDEIRPTLEMIRQNVNLQARLIDDLLDVMRIVRGKMPLHWEVADCHDLIDHAIQICRSEVSGGNLRLETDLAAKHHHINADPARWQQVLWNLIKNAVKFTPGGGTITIRTLNEEDHDGRGVRLVIEISDTGIGIAPEVLPRIFEPFQQGETTITRKFGGLGLGLAISRGIVEGHGGTITVESSGEGAGSTFRVELPSLPSPGSSGVGHATRFASGPARVMPLRILVVEDEPATLRLMARLLSGLGHEVTTANSITTALDRLATAEFDLVISDIGLPDGTGLELMRRIVASLGPVPAIALTGYGMEDDIQRSREAGFASHMTKPIDFTKLEAMIGRLVTGQGPEGQVPLPEGDKCP